MKKLQRKDYTTGLLDVPVPNPAGFIVGDDLETVNQKIMDYLGTLTQSGGTNIFIRDITSPQGAVIKTTRSFNGTEVVESIAIEEGITTLDITIEYDSSGIYAPDMTGKSDTTAAQAFATYSQIGTDRRFTSTQSITIVETDLAITIASEDGSSTAISMMTIEGAPAITNAAWGVYPGTQTEVKTGDTMELTLTFDDSSLDFATIKPDKIVVQAGGSITPGTYALPAYGANIVAVTLPVQHSFSGAVASNIDVTVVGENVNDSASAPYVAPTLTCNNLAPTFTENSVTYPVTQGAIKDAENATVDVLVTDGDLFQYTSPTGELSLSNPTTYEQAKVVSRVGGSYNVTNNNYRVEATRNANASVASYELVVNIAHVDTVITVTTPAARLRSGGAFGTAVQNHTIGVLSSQILVEDPTLGLNSSGAGTLSGSLVSSGGSNYQQNMLVDDTDSKGTFGFNILATNLAGKVVNLISTGSSYVLGGFVSRTLTFAAFASKTELGTQVSDTAKISALNNAKGVVAQNYVATKTPQVNDAFTIIDFGSGVENPAGDGYWDVDGFISANNASGTATITIEEIV